jgi:hypothetical protein
MRLFTRMSDTISIAHSSIESSPACRNAERAASLGNVTRLLAAHFGARPLSVYEAGGGSTSYIPLGGLSVSHITLVDIDPRQVDRNDIGTRRSSVTCRRSNFPPQVSISSSAIMSSSTCRACRTRWSG